MPVKRSDSVCSFLAADRAEGKGPAAPGFFAVFHKDVAGPFLPSAILHQFLPLPKPPGKGIINTIGLETK
ncbi:hypothetical protein DXA36_22370 [Eisenbergiella sp. OF01-20]|nr:hypothetical protein DXA36_22370 [Eisenbergiella sp. OF01-20]